MSFVPFVVIKASIGLSVQPCDKYQGISRRKNRAAVNHFAPKGNVKHKRALTGGDDIGFIRFLTEQLIYFHVTELLGQVC